MNTPRMRLKRSLSQIPFIAYLISQHDQGTLRQALQQELHYNRTTPAALGNFERRFFSQNGEDGIIEEILRRVGVTDRYFVEFGIGTGIENCCRYLLEKCGWQGLWLEGDALSVERANARFASLPVQIVNQFLTRENILQIFAEANVPDEFDLLVIDVDGNDYWLWEKISARYSPRVVIIEYNAAFTPDEYWVMPYNPDQRWAGDWYFGASLKASTQLAKERGYELVTCDSNGVNAFFVRRDLLHGQFSDLGNLRVLHRTFKYNALWYGHVPYSGISVFRMEPVTSQVINRLRLSWTQAEVLQIKTGSLQYASLELDNQSDVSLISASPYPVMFSYQWINAQQITSEGFSTPLASSSEPHSHNRYLVRFYAPPDPGTYTLRMTLVQGTVGWFFESNMDCAVTTSVEVVV